MRTHQHMLNVACLTDIQHPGLDEAQPATATSNTCAHAPSTPQFEDINPLALPSGSNAAESAGPFSIPHLHIKRADQNLTKSTRALAPFTPAKNADELPSRCMLTWPISHHRMPTSAFGLADASFTEALETALKRQQQATFVEGLFMHSPKNPHYKQAHNQVNCSKACPMGAFGPWQPAGMPTLWLISTCKSKDMP